MLLFFWAPVGKVGLARLGLFLPGTTSPSVTLVRSGWAVISGPSTDSFGEIRFLRGFILMPKFSGLQPLTQEKPERQHLHR